jgi:hypothetical protein
MRLLLDENMPKRLKEEFRDHEIYTIREKGWNGVKNGQLLQLLLENAFDALLTFDKNLRFQQNFEKYPITVFVFAAPVNSYIELSRLCPQVRVLITNGLKPGAVIIKE